ncbi:MAG: hypothetical protein VKJ64_15260 [Leptolyngbyaceae bacterium]|nr:hypothetical protein [Leptolyngbyaceae bacterium]
MTSPTVKEQARRLIDNLPADCTWDDIMHQIYISLAVEAGLSDREAGRVKSVEAVRAQFGLNS